MSKADIAALLAFLFTGLSWLGAIFMKYRLQAGHPPVVVPKFRTESKAALTMIAWISFFMLFALLLG